MNKKQFLWISKQQLDVLKKVAPTNHIRHYLNGIFINPKGYLEATDGFVAIRIKIDDVNELPKEPILLTHSVINDAVSIGLNGVFYKHKDHELNGIHVAPITNDRFNDQYPDFDRIFSNAIFDPVPDSIKQSNNFQSALISWQSSLNTIYEPSDNLAVEKMLNNSIHVYNNEKKCVIFQYKNIEMAFLM